MDRWKQWTVALALCCLTVMVGAGCAKPPPTKAEIKQFLEAAEKGDLPHLELLLKDRSNPELINARNDKGETPLLRAAVEGHQDVVGFLLEQGAEVDASDKDGDTALMLVVWYGGTKSLAEFLIANGADVNARTTKSGLTALHMVAYDGSKEMAEMLIASGADVNVMSETGLTPCAVASAQQNQDVYQVLRKHGGKVFGKGTPEVTPVPD